MPKEKSMKKSDQNRHNPLSDEILKPTGKLRAPNQVRGGGAEGCSGGSNLKNKRKNPNSNSSSSSNTMRNNDDEDSDDDMIDDDMEMNGDDEDEIVISKNVPKNLSKQIYDQAKQQRISEMNDVRSNRSNTTGNINNSDDDDDDYEDDINVDDHEEEEDNDMVEYDGDYVGGAGLSAAEEAVVQKFLTAGRVETRTLADIIMEKIREKEEARDMEGTMQDTGDMQETSIPPKVVEVYTSVGKLLHHYKSGKLPKALKMLPHLKNWEDVLWLTRPDQWSPCATFACTRIFSSNLNAKMTQRFLNLVLLEKCRDDIRVHDKLNYHLYMALKKAVYKPAAFYKGLLLPLAQSNSCTLREATIISSVIAKVSIPNDHSAAALLRLAEMPYSGSTSMFLKVLLNKKYALPRRVIEALVTHFSAFENERRDLPVIWHQALLIFVQRYKNDIDDAQKERLKPLLKSQNHHQITGEVRRELFSSNTTGM